MASVPWTELDDPGDRSTAPSWLKRRGGELPSRARSDVHREYREVEQAFREGRATEEQLQRALERLATAEL